MSADPFGMSGEDFEFDIPVDVDRPPEGIAIVQLVNVEQSVSKAGNAMLVWDFILREYLEPADAGTSFEGENLKVYTALSKAAAWKVQETLEALGFTVADKRSKFTRNEAIGRIARAVIKYGEFNGQTTVNIDALATPPDGAGTKRDMPAIGHTPGGQDIPF